jgi:hypothetical protein
VVHICDGCERQYIQLDNDELPRGFYLTVVEIHSNGGDSGNLFICNQRCLNKAFDRRVQIWKQQQ